jgi:hypothetical protein
MFATRTREPCTPPAKAGFEMDLKVGVTKRTRNTTAEKIRVLAETGMDLTSGLKK